ncbi:MAG TPA: cyclic nucleotide-binding domain-containing protein [Myxococcota bacterium]|nr:cyclic nucleotide-binding domain-containing protein [Myxococcota bacterium]HRY96464.1 cyclic nucleotide-binding domain-containing protein [Myxococcota bacterium]HSA22970.1 cyclic nucleotide-binding domain-containing protein [Myxococcota bacterium]
MISTVEKVLFLKSVDLFAKIPGEDLAQIAGIAQEVSFEQGELIIQEGEMGDSLFLIIEGQVQVHRLGREISKLGERDAFGEMALLDHEPRSASVTAQSDVTCLKVEREDFFELMSEKIEIAHGIIRVLTHRLREANEKLSVTEAG